MAGSPRIIVWQTTRSRAARRRARVGQGQAFGGAEEAPSLTVAVRDGDGHMRSGRKNARGAGRTKEWPQREQEGSQFHGSTAPMANAGVAYPIHLTQEFGSDRY